MSVKNEKQYTVYFNLKFRYPRIMTKLVITSNLHTQIEYCFSLKEITGKLGDIQDDTAQYAVIVKHLPKSVGQ